MPGAAGILLVALVTGVVLVNGFTDAPNAITGVVVTKTLSYRAAVGLAAACNLAGILLMSILSGAVARTMLSLADFRGAEPGRGVLSLCAAMLSIIVFAVAAWRYGIPTSESHALIAALAGGGLALGVRPDEAALLGWSKVIAGLVLSLGLGFFSGFVSYRLAGGLLGCVPRKRLRVAQIASAGAMAVLHGAQDGQKFMSVFIMAELLAAGREYAGAFTPSEHLPALLLCALTMALGTGMGGRRIIDTVGGKMVSMDLRQAVCADLGGAACLFLASAMGVPVSTTHTKTAAVMGVGAAGEKGSTNRRVIGSMLFAWTVTFPVCGLLGFLLTKLFVAFVSG